VRTITAGEYPSHPGVATFKHIPPRAVGGPSRAPRGTGIEVVRHTAYDSCMTMLSFRVDDEEAADAQQWAERLGVDRSELLRDALHRHLVRLRAEGEIEAWRAAPLTHDEMAFAEIADWGPAEDWSDWADAAG